MLAADFGISLAQGQEKCQAFCISKACFAAEPEPQIAIFATAHQYGQQYCHYLLYRGEFITFFQKGPAPKASQCLPKEKMLKGQGYFT